MDINTILLPVLSLGSMSLLFGLGLGLAGVKFAVEQDPKITLIKDVLPGANCGGCGFAGCDAFATAVAEGIAPPNGCPVGGAVCSSKIGEILGIEVAEKEREVAYVKCGGTCDKSVFRYDYNGLRNCKAVLQLAGGGSRSCSFGCVGAGSCEIACPFNAITIHDGIATVDREKCTACGKCMSACPRNLLAMEPYESKVQVVCNSNEPGKTVRMHCTVGCIGCKLCEKACKYDAIHVNNALARIDYDKCTMCNACVEKCPAKCIKRGGSL